MLRFSTAVRFLCRYMVCNKFEKYFLCRSHLEIKPDFTRFEPLALRQSLWGSEGLVAEICRIRMCGGCSVCFEHHSPLSDGGGDHADVSVECGVIAPLIFTSRPVSSTPCIVRSSSDDVLYSYECAMSNLCATSFGIPKFIEIANIIR